MSVGRDRKTRAAPGLRDLLAALEASPEVPPLKAPIAEPLPETPAPTNDFATAPADDYASQPMALWPLADQPPTTAPILPQPPRDAEYRPTPLHAPAPVSWPPPPAPRAPPMPSMGTSPPIAIDWGSSGGDLQNAPAAAFAPMQSLRPAVEIADARGGNRGLIASFGVIMVLAAVSGGAALFWQTAGGDPPAAQVSAAASQVRTEHSVEIATISTVAASARSIADVASLGPSPASLPPPQVPESHPVTLPPSVPASVPVVEPPPAGIPESRKGEDEERAQKYLRRGQQLLTEGDVAAARTFFGMSAEAGDAEAAMSMGATYDPNHLLQFGVRGMRPDPIEAIRWYQLAINLGSKDALDRIEALRVKK